MLFVVVCGFLCGFFFFFFFFFGGGGGVLLFSYKMIIPNAITVCSKKKVVMLSCDSGVLALQHVIVW